MTPDDFKRLWEADGDHLCPMSADELSGFEIPISARDFLIRVGLPEEAAPFLSFSRSSRANASLLLRTAIGPSEAPVVGSTASGDPVVVRLDGVIVYLNHDAGFAERYINKDVEAFAKTSLKMRQLIADAQRLHGPDAYLDGLVPAALREDFRSFLVGVDSVAIKPGALWMDEIANWAEGS